VIAPGAPPTADVPDGVSLRPAHPDEVAGCGAIWRDSINDYLAKLSLPLIPDGLGPIGRLHAHLHATDPDRFWVATRKGRSAPIGFGSATRRDDVWFLSMLFVRPGEQGAGIGRALLDCLLPRDGAARGTATDSLQPVSNALYASLGIVPRMPLLSLVGRPRADRPDALPALPSGVTPVTFETLVDAAGTGRGHRELADTVDALDREVAGFSHPQDHRYLRLEGRRGFLYQGPDGTPLGYGYTSEVGRIGPVAVRDPALLAPVVGHLLQAVQPRDASIAWVPGAAGELTEWLLRAGMRLDGFPILLCWDRPFADFGRYLPISPGLL
jgi:GNAT superfamily N-acetyltransferase